MNRETNRNYKDTIFRMLFKKPDNALSLYNALNGTSYKDIKKLQFNTLENAIYMNIKNDISFLIMNQINLYEYQSTYTQNMPLRDLLYVSDILQEYVKEKSLYSSRRINLPNPHFVVFYNGTEKKPEKLEYRLSDSFFITEEEPELELKVTVLNINQGMNTDLKEKCKILKEYMIYVDKVRNYTKLMPLNNAVEKAVEECIKENVLKEFLSKQRAEVIKMSIYEYDEEKELRIIRADEREIGKEIGRKEGEESARKLGIMVLIDVLNELNAPKDIVLEKVSEKFEISREEAEEYLNCK